MDYWGYTVYTLKMKELKLNYKALNVLVSSFILIQFK